MPDMLTDGAMAEVKSLRLTVLDWIKVCLFETRIMKSCSSGKALTHALCAFFVHLRSVLTDDEIRSCWPVPCSSRISSLRRRQTELTADPPHAISESFTPERA